MQKKEPVSKFSCMCQDHQPSCEAICQMRSSGVSLLYIKQLYTLPGVSRCQPPNSFHKPAIIPDAVCA